MVIVEEVMVEEVMVEEVMVEEAVTCYHNGNLYYRSYLPRTGRQAGYFCRGSRLLYYNSLVRHRS